MLKEHKIFKPIDKKLVTDNISFIFIPNYLIDYVGRFFNKEDLLSLDMLETLLSKDQLDKFKHLNTCPCSQLFNDNFIQSNPLFVSLLSTLPRYYPIDESSPDIGMSNPNKYYRPMECLLDGGDDNALLKVFNNLAANYCQRFYVTELKPNVYGLYFKEMDLIDVSELDRGNLSEIKSERFINDLSWFLDHLNSRFPLDYVSGLELCEPLTEAYSNCSEVWI